MIKKPSYEELEKELETLKASIKDLKANDAQVQALFDFNIIEDAHQQFAKNQEFQSFVFDNIPDLILVKDQDFKIILANKSFLGLYPESVRDAVIGSTTLEQYKPHERDLFLKQDRIAFQKGYSSVEETILFPDGITRTLLTRKIRFYNTDQVPFIVVIATDISGLKQIQQDLTEAKELAQAGTKAKAEFLANMSHEIRTPLNGIMGSLQLLHLELAQKENFHLVENALYSAKSLLTIINDILDFSKIEANQISLERVDFSIKKVFEILISSMKPEANNKNISLQFFTPNDLNDSWVGDKVRVSQILLNLVSNAVKFTEKGHVNLSAQEQVNKDRSGLLFKVTDTGIGMSKEFQKSLFERFTQADTSVTRKFGGTGLGMAITKELIGLMKGDINIESTEGVGTEVAVFLPLQKSKSPSKRNDSNEIIIPNLEGKTILLVEDNEINQAIIKPMLEATRANILMVDNGEDSIIQNRKNHIDLILMDIQMPGMDGTQACLMIRKENNSIPIIAFTANVMEEDLETYNASGFTDHLGKPVNMETLYMKLTIYLG